MFLSPVNIPFINSQQNITILPFASEGCGNVMLSIVCFILFVWVVSLTHDAMHLDWSPALARPKEGAATILHYPHPFPRGFDWMAFLRNITVERLDVHNSQYNWNNRNQWRIQYFSVGVNPEGAPTYYLTIFFRILHENEEFFPRRGTFLAHPPPRSATGNDCSPWQSCRG